MFENIKRNPVVSVQSIPASKPKKPDAILQDAQDCVL